MRVGPRALRLALALCAAFCASGCERPGGAARPGVSPAAGTPVAQVGEERILVEELRLPAAARDAKTRRQAVELAVSERLFAAEARRRGLDREDAVRRRLDAIRRDAAARERAVLREALVRELAGDARISESELKEHFEANQQRYQRRLYTLRHAAYGSKEAAEEAERALADGGSLESTRFAQLGPVLLHELPPAFQRRMSTVRRAGQTLVLQGDGEWLLVEVVDVQLAQAESYDEVRKQVFASLRQQRSREAIESLMGELKAGTQVSIDEAVLADDARWPEASRAAER